MDTVERLAAVEEIRALIATYAISFDDHDWDRFSALWTEDAAFVVVGQEAFEGREAMLEFLTTCLPDDYAGKHMNSPSLIEVAPDGESATAWTDVVWIPQNFENAIVARYRDTLVRRDGRWLFARREETPLQYKPGPPPMSAASVGVSAATMRTEEV
jgi:uncharacterized protein (TIGR02246 family)